MGCLKFNIKYSGKLYPIELEESSTGSDLRQEVEDLVKIPSDRQKYMIKGGLTDDVILGDVIKAGSSVMLLGTPDKDMLVRPKGGTKFVEDVSGFMEGDQIIGMPLGIKNLGNTCYINSTLQALYRIEPLREKIIEFNGERSVDEGVDLYYSQIIRELKTTFQRMKKNNGVPIMPLLLLELIRRVFPQFSEVDSQSGFYKQQDAEELFTQLFHIFKTVFGDEFLETFQIEFQTTIKDTMNESDVVVKKEDDSKLRCHISGSTNFLKSGLQESLKETISKRSDTTGVDSTFEITKKITKLPAYLSIQYVRFFWKKSTNKKSKILRKVQFPFQLDVADLLTPEYAKEKTKVREALREVDKEKSEAQRELKRSKIDPGKEALTLAEANETSQAIAESAQERWKREFASKFPDNLRPGENPSCVYDLVAVITHRGADSESGHYQSFIRDEIDEDKWYKFNDDKVSTIEKEKIESLSGGGESDSALILVYKGFGL